MYRHKVKRGIGDVDESSLVPSQRVLSWLESVELPIEAEKDCVFDITIVEMREGAVQGCDLFNLLLENSTPDITEALFLVGHFFVEDSSMNFRVLAQTTARRGNKASLIPLLPRGEQDFTVCANASMVTPI
jgi:hypothetical protein